MNIPLREWSGNVLAIKGLLDLLVAKNDVPMHAALFPSLPDLVLVAALLDDFFGQ